jgi:hypothetical protein
MAAAKGDSGDAKPAPKPEPLEYLFPQGAVFWKLGTDQVNSCPYLADGVSGLSDDVLKDIVGVLRTLLESREDRRSLADAIERVAGPNPQTTPDNMFRAAVLECLEDGGVSLDFRTYLLKMQFMPSVSADLVNFKKTPPKLCFKEIESRSETDTKEYEDAGFPLRGQAFINNDSAIAALNLVGKFPEKYHRPVIYEWDIRASGNLVKSDGRLVCVHGVWMLSEMEEGFKALL